MGEQFVEKEVERRITEFSQLFSKARDEIAKVVVGQKEMVEYLLIALIANGHVLLEGVPGIGKTLLVRTVSKVIGCSYSRIQFTPDLLPTDIVGVTTYEEGKGFFTVKGPVFANFVLGDEINRSPPKVQSALLEAMQERQVTIGKETFNLPNPFFVMATQNPVENLGTYKLPEAQLDRFIFKILMSYPSIDEEEVILNQNMSLKKFDDFELAPILHEQDLIDVQQVVHKVYIDEKIKKYIVRIVDATRYPKKYHLEKCHRYVDFGSSPRGGISLFIAAKARALTMGRSYVTHKDVKELALPILRHRILLNFEGQAEGISTDVLVKEILDNLPLM
ncbi:MAG: MoxR family ATPase [Nanoarchaeota archaeon]|nr:MoxR family ATPase [Nanoarchaeota archaeon]